MTYNCDIFISKTEKPADSELSVLFQCGAP